MLLPKIKEKEYVCGRKLSTSDFCLAAMFKEIMESNHAILKAKIAGAT